MNLENELPEPGSDGLIRVGAWIVATHATLPAYRKWWAQKKKAEKAARWPRLSQSLTGPRDPLHCQACGIEGQIHSPGASPRDNGATLQRWREGDEKDNLTSTIIILCDECAEKLIEKHPRLYDLLDPFAPAVGAMPVCNDCWFREALRCRHPDAKCNGGAGVQLNLPNPMIGFVDYGGKMRKYSGRMVIYRGPVDCESREAKVQEKNPALPL